MSSIRSHPGASGFPPSACLLFLYCISLDNLIFLFSDSYCLSSYPNIRLCPSLELKHFVQVHDISFISFLFFVVIEYWKIFPFPNSFLWLLVYFWSFLWWLPYWILMISTFAGWLLGVLFLISSRYKLTLCFSLLYLCLLFLFLHQYPSGNI